MISRTLRGSWFAEPVTGASRPLQAPASHPRTLEERAKALDDLEQLASSRVVGEIIRHRKRLAPVGLTIILGLSWVGPAVWRWTLLVFAVLSIASLGYFERRAWKDGRLSHGQMLATAWISGIAQLVVVFVLGGLAGPIAVALPLISVVMNLIAPTRFGMIFVAFVQVPTVWVFAAVQASGVLPDLVPSAWHGLFAPPGTPGWGPWFGAGFLSVVLLGGMAIGRALRTVLMQILREQVEDRDRELEMYEETTRALSQMTAEIAHELKNPLASIKGLAALVRKDLGGQTAERMDVLRREVDRLQLILDEFLSYSRPLVPIDEQHVDLHALTREVLELHEGIARQRDVRLVAPDGELHLRCDPRKIKRVLINLVQNAIEASPRDGEVRVAIERDGTNARIEVLDEGTGIASGADEKLFTVGFTTKDEGTGIGLALARGLARQHGGDLTLENRVDARGCVATLVLPPAPIVAQEVAS